MHIKEFQNEVFKNHINKGWDKINETLLGKLALVHSELSEAVEEIRNGVSPKTIYYNESNPNKPEGVPVELIDAMIRLFNICSELGIDVESVLKLKHEFNKTRPYLHGKKT